MGIGHFIWYPAGYEGPFEESFPKLVQFYRDAGIALPVIMEEYEDAPWNSKEELMAEKNSPQVLALTKFLYETRHVQVSFMYERLLESLLLMLEESKVPKHVEAQFERVSNSKGGYYPLIDYTNFKGIGVNPTESYEGYRWGLLQILEGMQGTELDKLALLEFSTNATMLLARRVSYAPIDRQEERWIRGWTRRTLTYITDQLK